MVSISDIAAPIGFAALTWWFSTGAILWLDHRPRHTFAWSLSAAGVLAIIGGVVVGMTAGRTDVGAAYLGFSAAIMIWAWHEMSFLMGVITGPRRAPLPAGVTGWKRFELATATVLHHELALAVTAVALAALTWGQPNQTAAAVFAALWALRLSAKFNLFLGAPYRSEEMLPAHLAHLASYFRHRRWNALLPVSLLTGAVAAWSIATFALGDGASAFERTSGLLVLALVALGLLEHLFLFAPPPNAWLWGWAQRGGQRRDP